MAFQDSSTLKRRIAGAKAHREGAMFEALVVHGLTRRAWRVLDIQDGCRRVSAKRMIPVKAPFDFVAAKDLLDQFNQLTTRTVYFDTKSTAENRFPPGKIKEAQTTQLFLFSSLVGARAGYLVHFQKYNQIVFFHVGALETSRLVRQGLTPQQGKVLGTIEDFSFDHIFENEQQP